MTAHTERSLPPDIVGPLDLAVTAPLVVSAESVPSVVGPESAAETATDRADVVETVLRPAPAGIAGRDRATPEMPQRGGRPEGQAVDAQPVGGGCTAAQLRRFIKSRAYVPMHELRRRFVINGTEDDVTRVSAGAGFVFVGLPPREGLLLGELLRGGDIGYELSLDPVTPVVIGVYPMRPVSRS